MYVEDFNTFYQQAEELVQKEPLRTRYVIKYKHKEGKLVLKVTDDVVVSRACLTALLFAITAAFLTDDIVEKAVV